MNDRPIRADIKVHKQDFHCQFYLFMQSVVLKMQLILVKQTVYSPQITWRHFFRTVHMGCVHGTHDALFCLLI